MKETRSPRVTAPGPYAWTAVILFGLANAVAFMDRGFINLVVEPIRLSLGLSVPAIVCPISWAILFWSRPAFVAQAARVRAETANL